MIATIVPVDNPFFFEVLNLGKLYIVSLLALSRSTEIPSIIRLKYGALLYSDSWK